jgi:hypothetical protein
MYNKNMQRLYLPNIPLQILIEFRVSLIYKESMQHRKETTET